MKSKLAGSAAQAGSEVDASPLKDIRALQSRVAELGLDHTMRFLDEMERVWTFAQLGRKFGN